MDVSPKNLLVAVTDRLKAARAPEERYAYEQAEKFLSLAAVDLLVGNSLTPAAEACYEEMRQKGIFVLSLSKDIPGLVSCNAVYRRSDGVFQEMQASVRVETPADPYTPREPTEWSQMWADQAKILHPTETEE